MAREESAGRPNSVQLDRIVRAHEALNELGPRHKAEVDAALAELRTASRSISEIENMPDRVAVAAWAFENTSARQNDLAFGIFQDENRAYHLRKLLAGPYRSCKKCGQDARVGGNFQAAEFYCGACGSTVHAERQKRWSEMDRQRELRALQRDQKIAELKAKASLSDDDANELAALIISRADGPLFDLSDFIRDSIKRDP